MTPSITLISLACAIANGGTVDTSSLTAQLSKDEQAQVEQIIDAGLCLPEKMEILLKQTRSAVRNGTLNTNGVEFLSAPSEICTKVSQ